MTDNNGQDMNIDKSEGSQFGNFFDSKPESGNFGVNLESFEKDRKSLVLQSSKHKDNNKENNQGCC